MKSSYYRFLQLVPQKNTYNMNHLNNETVIKLIFRILIRSSEYRMFFLGANFSENHPWTKKSLPCFRYPCH